MDAGAWFSRRRPGITAEAVVRQRSEKVDSKALVSVSADTTLEDAIKLMRAHAISQVPVTEGDAVVGSLTERDILRSLIGDPDARARLVQGLMGEPFPIVEYSSAVQDFASNLGASCPAVLVRQRDGELSILTRSDLIGTLGA